MKLKDIGIYENEFMDLSLKSHSNPEDDRSGVQGDDSRRKPVITLRHINKLKRMKSAQREEQEKRKRLIGIMYAPPAAEEEAV